jgi:hypothetical protein
MGKLPTYLSTQFLYIYIYIYIYIVNMNEIDKIFKIFKNSDINIIFKTHRIIDI